MKCRYTFRVRSQVILDPPVRFTHRGWKFSLETENGRFSRLVVEVAGVTFSEFPRVEHPPGSTIPHFRIPTDPMLPLVQNEIRATRGALALWGIHDIDTDRPKSEWIPENQAEHEATHILGISREPPSRDTAPPRPAVLNLVVRCFLSREKFLPHEIPLEFHRRGSDDVCDERYIEAIYDFYFVLEYLFGDGKYAQHSTREAFLASGECCAAITKSQADPLPEITENPRLHREFHDKYRSKTTADVVDAIIALRGFLHHQSLKRRVNWNPGVQNEFKTDALFLQRVCHEAVMQLSLKILFDPQEMADFQATQFFGPNNIRINWVPEP